MTGLLACLRATGLSQAQVPWQTSLAAFAFIRLLTALPITPGGLGITELGLAGTLAAGAGHTVGAQVTAAVLLYRACSPATPLPPGSVTARRHDDRPRAALGAAAGTCCAMLAASSAQAWTNRTLVSGAMAESANAARAASMTSSFPRSTTTARPLASQVLRSALNMGAPSCCAARRGLDPAASSPAFSG